MSHTKPKPKPFVFVLMPFSEEFDDIYELGIKDTCSKAGAYCERVDEQLFQGNINDRIYNQIAKADIIISEMTGRNANVFYETGYAHALGKNVILLTQTTEDIPFDLVHYPHIVYNAQITKLRNELAKRISWAIKNPEKSLKEVDKIFPESWDSVRLRLLTGGEGIELNRAYNFSLNVFTNLGTRIYPFSIRIKPLP